MNFLYFCQCSKRCDYGLRTRQVKCITSGGFDSPMVIELDQKCNKYTKPSSEIKCKVKDCGYSNDQAGHFLSEGKIKNYIVKYNELNQSIIFLQK